MPVTITKKKGVREKKSAILKLKILDSTVRLLGQKSFKDLYVSEICAKASTSKVTLFKYFPQKDDILLYYIRTWCFHRVVELHHKPKEGIDGIRFLFDRVADTFEQSPGLILNLISYFTALKRPPSPFPLRTMERKLLYPNEENLEKIEILSIDQMMERFILEAIFKGQITTSGDTKELTNIFIAMLYGSIVTAHLRQISPIKILFKRNIDNLLQGLR